VRHREKLRTEVEGVTEVHIVGRSKKTQILLDRDYVVESQNIAGKTFTQKQPEGSFSQPNGAMCEKMVSWAELQTRGSDGDLLELYCGNGNFTIPLAANFRRVVATEVSASAVHLLTDRFNPPLWNINLHIRTYPTPYDTMHAGTRESRQAGWGNALCISSAYKQLCGAQHVPSSV
jgi:tRNA (uracil-5-)-methyltransferase